MEVLKQCQKWFEQNEIQKVIAALEAIPSEERTPELDCELAKAYITIAEVGERKPFEKALQLLALHEETGRRPLLELSNRFCLLLLGRRRTCPALL